MDYRSRKYSLNQSFFSDIKTEAQAYVLGYLFADGCIRDQYTFSIGSKDIELIELVRREMEANYKIYEHKKTVGEKVFICHELTMTSKPLIQDLVGLGCTKNKSYKELTIPQSLPDHLVSHFIRGYFDGDGGVCPSKPYGDLCVYFTGCLTLLSQIQKELESHANVRHVKIQKHAAIYKLSYKGNRNAKRIREYIYNDASLYLERKQRLIYSRNPK